MTSNDQAAELIPKLDDETAINRVLQAERELRNAMQECDQQAKRVFHEAHERARHINQRAEQRVQHWYLKSNRRTAKRLRDLEEQTKALQSGLPESSDLPTKWRLAVQQLVKELIGLSD